MAFLFKSSKELGNRIDEMLDAIAQGILVYEEAIIGFFEHDAAVFNECVKDIDSLEARVDQLRRDIENDLYRHSLIPEHRGDVLGLLESIDDVIDNAKETLYQFLVEQPFFEEDIAASFKTLTSTSVQSAEALVMAVRAFFRNVNTVKDHLHKVYFYEKKADSIHFKLKQTVFRDERYSLPQMMHLRYFALHIDQLADISEAVADRLSIYTIKRTI